MLWITETRKARRDDRDRSIITGKSGFWFSGILVWVMAVCKWVCRRQTPSRRDTKASKSEERTIYKQERMMSENIDNNNFFRGVCIGLLLAAPFWAAVVWFCV